MKIRVLALVASALLVFGGVADHLFFSSSSPAAAASSASVESHTGAASTGASTTSLTSSTANISAAAIDQATTHAYAVASQSVVYVNAGDGTGSGVIYDTNGDIVTNNHVVSGATTTLSVTLSDGRTFPAKLVGTDPADDLAVIKINASNLQPATFAQAGTYHVAQTVLAIGSPLGLKDSVSSGLISGTNRVQQEPNGSYIPNAVQTSAPINPGNSGGALVTLNGVVVGIPTLEQTSTSNGTNAQDIGFAVPSERVLAVVPQIISTGKVQHTGRPYLGIAPGDPSSQSLSPFGFGGGNATSVSGAVVEQVAGNGPAGKAGVQQGDVITSLNGHGVTDAQDLLALLAQKKPGNTVNLTINRNGNTVHVSVRLGELPG